MMLGDSIHVFLSVAGLKYNSFISRYSHLAVGLITIVLYLLIMTTLTQLAERLYATDSEFYDEVFHINGDPDVITYLKKHILYGIQSALEDSEDYDSVCEGIFTEAELIPFIPHALDGTLPA